MLRHWAMDIAAAGRAGVTGQPGRDPWYEYEYS